MTSQTVDIADWKSIYRFDEYSFAFHTANSAAIQAYLSREQFPTSRLITRFSYDELGRRIEVSEAMSEALKYENAAIRRTYYDARGNVVKQDKDAHARDVVGGVTEFMYDALNRKLTETYRNGNSVDTQTWSYQNGQLLSYRDMSDKITAYRYDSAGRLTKEYCADAALNQIAGQKNISYAYDIYGNVTEINDAGTLTMTRYAYDAAGRRTWEQIIKDGVTTLQNNYLSYDELGRLRRVEDGRFSLTYDYDANGNREHVSVNNYRDGAPGKTDLWSSYDSMNRLRIADGVKDTDGNVTISQNQGHSMQYDKAGRVIEDKSYGKVAWWDGSNWGTRDNVLKTVNYTYDKMGRLVTSSQLNEGDNYNYVTDVRAYDAYGRLVRSGTGMALLEAFDKGQNASFRQAMADSGLSVGAQLNTYRTDYVTQINTEKAKDVQAASGISFSQIDHVDTFVNNDYSSVFNRYDDAGNIRAVVTGTERENAQVSNYFYKKDSGYTVSRIAIYSMYKGSQDPLAESNWTFNVNGHATEIKDRFGKNRTMEVDTAGHILRSTQSGQTNYALLINDEIVGNSSKEAKDDTIGRAWQSAMSLGAGQNSSSYIVQSGDSFASIAKKVWGDSSLWFLIADANGLSGDSSLQAGQTLIVPARTAGLHNNTGTSKSYNPADILGDTSPTFAQPQGADDGCGTFGMVVMIAVAAVATIYTAGLFTSTATEFGAILADGASALGGGLGFGQAFIAGATGSIASQAVGMAMGNVKEFSWSQVAVAGIGTMVGNGLAEYMPKGVSPLERAGWSAARSMVGSAMTNVITNRIGLTDQAFNGKMSSQQVRGLSQEQQHLNFRG
jgi:YD repeat-containing protein